jgi:FixJ family two-component response regulator
VRFQTAIQKFQISTFECNGGCPADRLKQFPETEMDCYRREPIDIIKWNVNRSMPAPIIHIVDDDESFRTAITRLLRARNYEVRTYSNANDFLLRHVDEGPGCILLDLRMPGPSGLALQEVLATRREPLPIIFLSGHADLRTTTRALQAGAFDFLTKPVQPKDLIEAIGKALARDAENRAARERLEQVAYEFRATSAPVRRPRL